MMLDDAKFYKEIDLQDMQEEIVRLPDHLESAWGLGKSQPVPQISRIDSVLIGGMGGSAIGADLLGALFSRECRVPVVTLRDYSLPAWAAGEHTLFIASSHSGNTEETLAAFAAAKERGCSRMAVCTGGRLAAAAAADGVPVWQFEHSGQPRAGVGLSFGLLLAAFARLGLIADPAQEVGEAIAAMRDQAKSLTSDVPAVQNPAKRYAGQLMDRNCVVFGSEFLIPVARRWKTQINELAKAWAQFEEIPEANHNALAGLEVPVKLTAESFAMFLVSPGYNPRNALRMELTRKQYMLEGISTDFYLARGESRMAQQWTALQFGDYVSYYLAIAYGLDPTPVDALVAFKDELAGR